MDIRKYARIFLNIAVPLMTIYLICVWGPRLLGFFIPFVIGWVVAMIANPLVRFLEKKIRIVRRHSSHGPDRGGSGSGDLWPVFPGKPGA